MSEGINLQQPANVGSRGGELSRTPVDVIAGIAQAVLGHWSREQVIRFVDAAAWIIAAEAACRIWFGSSLGHASRSLVAVTCIMPFCTYFIFPAMGCYRPWRTLDYLKLLKPLLLATSMVSLIGLSMVFLMHEIESLSRIWFLLTVFFAFTAFSSIRLFAAGVQRWLRQKGIDLRRIMVISNAGMIDRILDLVRTNPGFGYKVIGVAGECQSSGLTPDLCFLDRLDRLNDFIVDQKIDEVWIGSLPDEGPTEMQQYIGSLQQTAATIRWVPDMRWHTILGHREEQVMGMPSLLLNATALDSMAGRIFKAVFDRCFAFLVLFLLFPLLLLIALLVKLSSPGPVLFGQLRQGFSGRPFRCLKFRSMVMHAENGTVTQATANDRRITPIGRILRKTSLDELPQFINVLLGDMSVVGPRPHAVQHNEFYSSQIERYMQRHRVKPGITGWAQVNGCRGETDTLDKMARRVEHDIYYMNNWSFLLDMKIIIWTAFKGWTGQNAY